MRSGPCSRLDLLIPGPPALGAFTQLAAELLLQQFQERLLTLGQASLFSGDDLLNQPAVIGYHGPFHLPCGGLLLAADARGAGDAPSVAEPMGHVIHRREHVLLSLVQILRGAELGELEGGKVFLSRCGSPWR